MAANKRSSASSPSPTDSCDRLAGESAQAFEAFATYRDMAPGERSLTAVGERISKNKSLCARWSAQHNWMRRVQAWDASQDQLRRKRLAAEREKIHERQLNHTRIASQALMTPLIALAKRAQNPESFHHLSAADLVKLASIAARSLPRIHQDERNLAGSPGELAAEQKSLGPGGATQEQKPITIVGAEFTWVQSRCVCGHVWDAHAQLPEGELTAVPGTPCNVAGCECGRFTDEEDHST